MRRFLAIIAVLPALSGCGSTRASVPPRYSGHATPGQPLGREDFRPGAGGQLQSQRLYLPGSQREELVSFRVVDGIAVMEGDIQLGPVASLTQRYGSPWSSYTHTKSAMASSNRSHLWPRGELPYAIDATVPPDQIENIGKAITIVNRTELKVRPRTTLDADYVVFSTSKGGCSSAMGRVGGMQDIQVGICGPGSIAHEILHAAGFYHEQSRSDRDAFITIIWDEIEPEFRFAFEKRSGQELGGYDYASVMHYEAKAFSRTGKPTIIPTVPNAPIGQRADLSAGDKAAITALYGLGSGTAPGGWSLPLPTTLPFPTALPLPTFPGAPTGPTPTAACGAGQVKDFLLQTCATPCPNGSPPIAGACAPGAGGSPPAGSPSSTCATPTDLLSGKCFPTTAG